MANAVSLSHLVVGREHELELRSLDLARRPRSQHRVVCVAAPCGAYGCGRSVAHGTRSLSVDTAKPYPRPSKAVRVAARNTLVYATSRQRGADASLPAAAGPAGS